MCDSKKELAKCLKEYQAKVRVYNENGDSLTLKGFDVDKALGMTGHYGCFQPDAPEKE